MDSHQGPANFLVAWFIFFSDLNIAKRDPGLVDWRVDIVLIKTLSCTILPVIFVGWLFRVLMPYLQTMTRHIRPVITLMVVFTFQFVRCLTRPKYFHVDHVLVTGVTVSIHCLCSWHIFQFSTFLLARWYISAFTSCRRNAYVFNFPGFLIFLFTVFYGIICSACWHCVLGQTHSEPGWFDPTVHCGKNYHFCDRWYGYRNREPPASIWSWSLPSYAV